MRSDIAAIIVAATATGASAVEACASAVEAGTGAVASEGTRAIVATTSAGAAAELSP